MLSRAENKSLPSGVMHKNWDNKIFVLYDNTILYDVGTFCTFSIHQHFSKEAFWLSKINLLIYFTWLLEQSSLTFSLQPQFRVFIGIRLLQLSVSFQIFLCPIKLAGRREYTLLLNTFFVNPFATLLEGYVIKYERGALLD